MRLPANATMGHRTSLLPMLRHSFVNTPNASLTCSKATRPSIPRVTEGPGEAGGVNKGVSFWKRKAGDCHNDNKLQ